ncbi:MAG: antitoxin [Gemmatimonadaceae bacterium]
MMGKATEPRTIMKRQGGAVDTIGRSRYISWYISDGLDNMRPKKSGPSKTKAKKVSESRALYARAETDTKRASLFMNGRSQAVRLPKEFRFEGTHVFVRKEGNRVILSPADDRIERLLALMGSAPDFPEVEKDEYEPIRPEIEEFFGVSD